MNRFEGKIALITGAGSGIGRAVTVLLVEEGGTVFSIDVDAPTLKETASLAGENVRTHIADVRDPDACDTAVADCLEAFGRLDVRNHPTTSSRPPAGPPVDE